MTACTSFLAFFAEQTLAFAEKMHSRPDRWPSEARRAEVASTRSEAQCTATEHRAAVRRERCEDKRSGRFVGKPEVCQRSEVVISWIQLYPAYNHFRKLKIPSRFLNLPPVKFAKHRVFASPKVSPIDCINEGVCKIP